MATPRNYLRALLLSVGMSMMSMVAYVADAVVASFDSLRFAVLSLVQPTVEYSLKEINATGHTSTVESRNVVTIGVRRTRNSAAGHVSKQGILKAA